MSVCHGPFGESVEVHFKGFYHIWAYKPFQSYDLDHLNKLSFVHSKVCLAYPRASVASGEIKILKEYIRLSFRI